MRREGQSVMDGVTFESKESAQHRADYHCRGPNLVRRTGRKWLVIIAGQYFRHMARGSIEREQRVGAQIVVSRLRPVIPVFRDRRPSREQRPHRAVVISSSAIFRRVV